MSLRFVPKRDLSDKRINIPPSTVRYSDLTQNVKDIIDQANLTEEELLQIAIGTLRNINLCLAEMSGLELEEDDIVWAL
ncbi:hypothetical protein LCGC14_1530660 [marine sediment metagenome]|uniref:Uncharacterized protein n=1 Tax=marine sediment metagenome TaxID=412755 RepID=A0A0F9IWA1_9ZZZZ